MRGMIANIAGVLGGAAVLGLGLWIGAPEAEAAGSGSQVRLGPPVRAADEAVAIPLGESMELFGQPSQLSLFWTVDSPEEVARLYTDTWKAAGFEPHLTRLDRATHVSAIDPETGLMRAVTILAQAEETLVLPAITDVRVMPDLTSQRAPVPVPENARAYMGHSADDTSQLTFTGSYLVPLRPEQVLRFYERELAGEGYERREGFGKGAKGAKGVEYVRGPEQITIVASITDEKAEDAGSFVVLTHSRQLEVH